MFNHWLLWQVEITGQALNINTFGWAIRCAILCKCLEDNNV